ncbi:MAG: DUF2080 family transposase-associated protein [DPANN group archaeon]|nr:DUF2080 family transposase-associated protein [DPANN group archaeon]
MDRKIGQTAVQVQKLELKTQNRLLLNNVAGIFETDAKGAALKVKEFGNGAMIPFSKKYLGKRVVVLVVEK